MFLNNVNLIKSKREHSSLFYLLLTSHIYIATCYTGDFIKETIMKTIKISKELEKKIIAFCDDELNYHINDCDYPEEYKDEIDAQIELLKLMGYNDMAERFEEALEERLLEEDDAEEPIEISNSNDTCVKETSVITREDFFKDFVGATSQYSSYLILNTTVDDVIKSLSKLNINPSDIRGGFELDGNVEFKIFGEWVDIIEIISKDLKTTAFADTAWDYFDFVAYKNGEKYNDYTTKWEDADNGPRFRDEDGYEEDDKYATWDCHFSVTDNATGIIFYSGMGAADKEIKEQIEEIVNSH